MPARNSSEKGSSPSGRARSPLSFPLRSIDFHMNGMSVAVAWCSTGNLAIRRRLSLCCLAEGHATQLGPAQTSQLGAHATRRHRDITWRKNVVVISEDADSEGRCLRHFQSVEPVVAWPMGSLSNSRMLSGQSANGPPISHSRQAKPMSGLKNLILMKTVTTGSLVLIPSRWQRENGT
jgi:hypothetical protein